MPAPQQHSDRAVSTGEGRQAVREAVQFLHDAEPVPGLEMASCLNRAAARHAKEEGSTGGAGRVEHVLRRTIDVHLFCIEDIAD